LTRTRDEVAGGCPSSEST